MVFPSVYMVFLPYKSTYKYANRFIYNNLHIGIQVGRSKVGQRGAEPSPKAGRPMDMTPTPVKDIENKRYKTNEIVCKHCGGYHITKKGFVKGKQRYYCKDCQKTFYNNGTFPKMRYPKEIIRFALDAYFEGLSLRKVTRQIYKIWNVEVSNATIYRWIKKYVPMVNEYVDQFKANTQGHHLHHDETVIKAGGENIYYWDMIDQQTKFLLSGRVSGRHRGKPQARRMYKDALRLSEGKPEAIHCDGCVSYETAFYQAYGKGYVTFDSRIGINSKGHTNNPIERFHSTLKDRLKPMRGLKNPNAVMDGFRIHYNYIRPHQSLKGKTPAQASGIDLPFNDGWGNLIDWATWNKHGYTVKPREKKEWKHVFHRCDWN